MQATEESLMRLAALLQQANDPDKARRTEAETSLEIQKISAGFPQLILALVSQPGAPIQLRQSAAVFFKNLVKNHWSQGEDQTFSIADADREAIRAQLVGIYLQSPSIVQNLLGESIALIGSHGLLTHWPGLIPEIVGRMSSNDFDTIYNLLKISNTLFKRYRYEFKSDSLWSEIKFVLEHLQVPLLQFTQYASSLVDSNAQNKQALQKLFDALIVAVKLFFSLCAQEMASYFEEHLGDYVQLFIKYLNYQNPILAREDPDLPGQIEKIQYRICQALTLCVEKYLEDYDFDKYVSGFVITIRQLLVRLDGSAGNDKLTTGAIAFLSAVSKSSHSVFLLEPGVIQEICERVIIPNIVLREKDEELFEDTPLDYIRQDSEGSDADTRRRVSSELIKAIGKNYQAQVTQMFLTYITGLLQKYETNPTANWKDKDTAIYLTTSLAVKSSTMNRGITVINEQVNVVEFFQSHILNELKNVSSSNPILKASCVKFVTVFRNQIPGVLFAEFFPLLVNFVAHPSIVVSSYAAISIERLMTVKDGQANRYGKDQIRPFLTSLLGNLFGVLRRPDCMENHYIMRCIMRACSVAQEETGPLVPTFIDQFNTIIAAVCKNPTNPAFNHYLFETIASLVKFVCSANATSVTTFENLLFPSFQYVLQTDVTDFTPYVYQIISQLLELRPSGVPQSLLDLLPHLIHPNAWNRQGNVPGLTRLFEEFFRKAGEQLAASTYFTNILGVFQKLIASKATDTEGFSLLCAIYENVSQASIDPHMGTVLVILMKRLQTARTNKFLKGLIRFLGLVAGKVGGPALVNYVNAVQNGLFNMIFENIIIPNFNKLDRALDQKIVCVGFVRLITEVDTYKEPAVWTKAITGLVEMLENSGAAQTQTDTGNTEDDYFDADEVTEFSNVFSRLHYASNNVHDPFPDVFSGQTCLVMKLVPFLQANPGRYGATLGQSPAAVKLQAYLTAVQPGMLLPL